MTGPGDEKEGRERGQLPREEHQDQAVADRECDHREGEAGHDDVEAALVSLGEVCRRVEEDERADDQGGAMKMTDSPSRRRARSSPSSGTQAACHDHVAVRDPDSTGNHGTGQTQEDHADRPSRGAAQEPREGHAEQRHQASRPKRMGRLTRLHRSSTQGDIREGRRPSVERSSLFDVGCRPQRRGPGARVSPCRRTEPRWRNRNEPSANPVADATHDVQGLVKSEIALAKAEVQQGAGSWARAPVCWPVPASSPSSA